MWLKSEDFVDEVKEWWTLHSFQGSSSYVLKHKLKALKADFKSWNDEAFENVGRQKKLHLDELCIFEVIKVNRMQDVEEKTKDFEKAYSPIKRFFRR